MLLINQTNIGYMITLDNTTTYMITLENIIICII